MNGKSWFRRSLLSFQFFLSYVSITTALAFILNTKFQREKEWGYDQENKLIVKTDDPTDYRAMINEVKQQPAVLEASGSAQSFGIESNKVVVKIEGQLHTTDQLKVGAGFLDLMSIPLKEGKSFSRDNESGNLHSLLVNETFLTSMAVERPINSTLFIGEEEFTIIGVVNDFHFEPFTELVKPLVISYAPEDQQRYLALHYAAGEKENLKTFVKTTWKKISPEKPLVMYDQNTVFDNAFRSFDTATNVMISAAFVTVLIGIFGLFGLSSLTLSRKLKEMAIRKVMGSTATELGWVLNKEIVWLLIIACATGVPLSYLFINSFLPTVSLYPMPLEASLFAATLIILFAVALLAVSVHLFRLVNISPAQHLRNE